MLECIIYYRTEGIHGTRVPQLGAGGSIRLLEIPKRTGIPHLLGRQA